jgi:hypothetical protein
VGSTGLDKRGNEPPSRISRISFSFLSYLYFFDFFDFAVRHSASSAMLILRGRNQWTEELEVFRYIFLFEVIRVFGGVGLECDDG